MKVHIVLVRSESAANIGSAARAMANMGGDRLILIDPRCELDSSARQLAAGARDQLGDVVVYGTWEDFYAQEGEGVRIALTRRAGRKRRISALDETLGEISASLTTSPSENIYLIFGPEADGLDSDDLAFVNFTCHLPVYGEFASLNLAQAVLLTLFLCRQRFPPSTMPAQVKGEVVPEVQPFYFPDQLIKDWLTAMGFDIRARRQSAYLTLRRLLLQNRPTRHEIQVMEAILQQNIRKLQGSVDLTTEELADDLSDISI